MYVCMYKSVCWDGHVCTRPYVRVYVSTLVPTKQVIHLGGLVYPVRPYTTGYPWTFGK